MLKEIFSDEKNIQDYVSLINLLKYVSNVQSCLEIINENKNIIQKIIKNNSDK